MKIVTSFLLFCSASLFFVACNKDGNKDGDKSAAAPAGQEGCGKDYGDPMKMYCVTLPAKYTAGSPKSDTLAPERINFDGPEMGDGITVSYGFDNSEFKTYEDQLKSDEAWTKGKDKKVLSSGATTGNAGKWWLVEWSGTKKMVTTVKTPDGKAVKCDVQNTMPSQGAIDACKTLRPYPKKS
jgi:hypothetical protein